MFIRSFHNPAFPSLLSEESSMKIILTVLALLTVLSSSILAQDTVQVKAGWNIIGSLDADVPPDSLVSDPPGIITTAYFGYEPGAGYESATTLEKGKGYWVKVSDDGAIIFEGSNAGVNWEEASDGIIIPTTSTALASVMINAPTSGYVIVTASGSVYWNTTAAAGGLVRLKVSEYSGNTLETPGVQFIRFQSVPVTGPVFYPFSVTKVFTVSAGSNTFFLNGLHQVVNGAAYLDDHTLVAVFVPRRYGS
jgi:hypothetical protein